MESLRFDYRHPSLDERRNSLRISGTALPKMRVCGRPHTFAVPMSRARCMLRAVEGAVAKWCEVDTAIGVTEQELDQYGDAFEHDERQAAQAVGR